LTKPLSEEKRTITQKYLNVIVAEVSKLKTEFERKNNCPSPDRSGNPSCFGFRFGGIRNKKIATNSGK